MKIGIISFTQQGALLAEKIKMQGESQGWSISIERCTQGGLRAWTQEHFAKDDALLFIGSSGIAIRATAPFIKSKVTDPAVVVMDEAGSFVIPLLSGHLGGANALSKKLASMFGAVAVLTTATDVRGVFSVDGWAQEQGLMVVNPENIKEISSRLLDGKEVTLRSAFPIEGKLPEQVLLSEWEGDISITNEMESPRGLHLVAPVVTLGVGCRRGTPKEKIEEAWWRTLLTSDIHPKAVFQVCSIDLKQEEPGIAEFCAERGLPFTCFSAEELQSVKADISSSAFVKSITGVDNVCERSALFGAGEGAVLVKRKGIFQGVTMALAMKPYIVRFEEGL